MTSVTRRMARWSARHPWRALALWLGFVAACVVGGSAAGLQSATDADLRVGESGRAQQMLAEAGLQPPSTEHVLITSPGGALPGDASTVADVVAADLRELPGIASVAAPAVAPDGAALLVTATVEDDAEPGQAVADVVEEVARATPGLRVERVSEAAVGDDINDRLAQDFRIAELTSVPVTLVILLIAFGALIAAGLPVLLALSSVAAAVGLAAFASRVVPDGGTTTNMILLMGMAVGVDYSLFYLKRERAERASGAQNIDAIEIAAATSGRSVVVSGLAVIVSMAGLYLVGDVVFASLATGSILVVAVAMLGSLTALPALLAKLGTAVDRPRLPLLRRLTGTRSRAWAAVLRAVLRHPLPALLIAVAALLGLAVPSLGLTLRAGGIESLPQSLPAVQSYHRLIEAFPSEDRSYVVVARAEDTLALQAALSRLAPANAGLVSDDGLTRTVSIPQRSGEQVELAALRARTAAALSYVPGATYAVGGDVAGGLDYAARQRARLPWVVVFVLALTFLVMASTFRSVVAAGLAIAVNLLSAGAAFGVLVLVFQRHWAEGLLGFTSTGSVISWIPLFTFVVLFGLSMDYHVFVVSRIREAAGRGVPTHDAVATGIINSAGVVTSAAAVMVAIFTIFASLSILEFKQLGVGLAVAVLVDVLVVRVVILPAAMALLGRANWWPSRVGAGPDARLLEKVPAQVRPVVTVQRSVG